MVESVIGSATENDTDRQLPEENKLFLEKSNTGDNEKEANSLELLVGVDKVEVSHYQSPKGNAEIQKVFIPEPTVIQTPELPNGCEITSLTAVLNYNEQPVSKLIMADTYLPKEPLIWEEDKRYGPDPYEAYAGDPREQPGGWFRYAPPIMEAANQYALDTRSNLTATDISGSTKERIYSYLDKGVPVIIWVTKGLGSPKVTSSWYLHDTEEYFAAPVNLHVVVLNGYRGNQVCTMNPLKGLIMLIRFLIVMWYWGVMHWLWNSWGIRSQAQNNGL